MFVIVTSNTELLPVPMSNDYIHLYVYLAQPPLPALA